MMFHIVLAAFYRFKLWVRLGYFTLFLCVVSCSMLVSFFNLCSLCYVIVFWFDEIVLVRFKLTRFGWFTSFQVA